MREAIEDFYIVTHDDSRIGVSHISLYFALLYTSHEKYQPFVIVRSSLMCLAKIHSRQTYNRCMNDLQEYGYISYTPSSDPAKGSTVFIVALKKN